MTAERIQTVLIVDDEKHLRDIIKFDLRKLGLKIIEAEDGEKALLLADQESIDLVVSDVRMPVATGVQLLKKLRDKNPGHPPFVFMTAFSDISSAEALALGAEAFLRKPVSKNELTEVVKRALIPKAERWAAQVGTVTEGARRFDFTTDAILSALADEATRMVEIGQGGMFLSLNGDFPSSFEVLRFKVDCGDARLGTIEGYGQVRWVRQEAMAGERTGIGVEFLQLEEKARTGLLKYLQIAAPKAYIPAGTA